jgi:subtilisin family serine protease
MFTSLASQKTLRRTILTLDLLLAISTSPGAAEMAQFNPSNIIPNRYLVVYRNATIPSDAETRIRASGAVVLARNQRFGTIVIQTPSTTETEGATAPPSKSSANHISAVSASPSADSLIVSRLAASSNVLYVVHDSLLSADSLIIRSPSTSTVGIRVTPNVPTRTDPDTPTSPPFDILYNSPQGWAVRQVGGYGSSIEGGPAHGPWDTTMGRGVRIAILDSGVDSTHPDISPNLALNLSEIDQNPQTGLPSICDDGTPQDQAGHGTWTASLAAGALGPGTGNVIGVAPAATLLNIKVLQRVPATNTTGTTSDSTRCESGQAIGFLSWVIQGIDDAITNRADIISMSIGTTVDISTGEGAGLKALFDQVTYAATQAGVVVIASAGNDGYNFSNSRYIELPAQARGVLAVVASTNPACAENLAAGVVCSPGPVTLPYYSNYGAPLNALSAPGGSYPAGSDLAVSGWIQGACSSGKPSTTDGLPSDKLHSYGCFNLGHTPYVQAMGTSASAPLAAGAAALVLAAQPTWSAAHVVSALRSSATQSTTIFYPEINAAAALSTP